ncbi:MAG: enoyl-CoA hydratase/isomerase family protein [Clostridia bacterium]
MEEQFVHYEVSHHVATITLNRPDKMNALSNELVEELAAALEQARTDAGVRSIILTGSGRAFSAGGDLSSFPGTQALNGKRYMQKAHRLLLDLYQLEKPTIAAVNGFATGAGFNIALCCDIVVANEQAMFGQVFSKVGLVPDFGGMYFLPRVVGMPRAKELMYSGRMISAREAQQYGIVLEVTEPEGLMERVVELAVSLAQGPTAALGMTKAILNRSFEYSLEQLLHEEAMAQGIAFSTRDHQEGVQAFSEKRKPVFTGE